jgi:hypothetical protein
VTVRTNDIALRDLFEQRPNGDATGHLRHESNLLSAVPVVEFHRAHRKRATAIGARQLAKADQYVHLLSTTPMPLFAPALHRRCRGDDVALGDLRFQQPAVLQQDFLGG